MIARAARWWPMLAGLVLSVNFYLLPFLETSPRATDLGGFALGCWIVVRLARGRQNPQTLAAAALVVLIPFIWVFFGVLNSAAPTVVLSVRWLLAAPWALALMIILDDRERQVGFAQGLLVGGLINVLVIILQSLGFEAPLQSVGLSSSGANYTHFVSHQVRIPGLHGHHNASSSVTSLLVPAGLFLYFRQRLRLSLLLLSLTGLLTALHLTSTRSPLLVVILTISFVTVLARRLRQSMIIGAVILGVLVPLVVVYGPPGGWARWKNTEALINNASERSDSGVGAIALCLEHPLGLGVSQARIQLSDTTGIRAAHNAFLQAALVWGLPFGLLILGGLVAAILQGAGGVSSPLFLPSVLAVQVFGLFMFEEHLNNPTFIVLTAWLVVVALTKRGHLRNISRR